jgi:hypothetical protein
MIIVAIAFGALLFFYGPSSFRMALSGVQADSFRVLKEGNDATNNTDRANFVIHNGTELNQLWSYIGATPGTAPNIDFTKEQVLAVFDGTHTTNGYRIQVTSVEDANGTRTVQVTRTGPGPHCTLASAITSPYQIVAVPMSSLPLAHVDTMATQDCP